MKNKIIATVSALMLVSSFTGASALAKRVTGPGFTTQGCVMYVDDGKGGTIMIKC